jgi:hypothetical protein
MQGVFSESVVHKEPEFAVADIAEVVFTQLAVEKNAVGKLTHKLDAVPSDADICAFGMAVTKFGGSGIILHGAYPDLTYPGKFDPVRTRFIQGKTTIFEGLGFDREIETENEYQKGTKQFFQHS